MAMGRSRPLWRSVTDALVFLSVLFIVLVVLNRFKLLEPPAIDLGAGEFTVIDGDSLRRGETEIRLVGIDAPEYRQSCADPAGRSYSCGKQAASALQILVASGKLVCESHETDRYQRALSTCRAGQVDINRQMVRDGWAVAYGFKGHEFDYAADEDEARRLKRGLWQGKFDRPSDYRKRQRVVEGNATGLAGPDD